MMSPTQRLSAVAVFFTAGAAAGAPPVFTLDSVARSGQTVPGVGQITSSVAFGQGTGPGIPKTAISNSGAWLIEVKVLQTNTDFDNALLRSVTGLSPYIAEGVPGPLLSPAPGYVASAFHSFSLNNSGDVGLGMGLFADDFTTTPESGVNFNTGATPVYLNGAISAAGLAPATTWNQLDGASRVVLNDNRQLLVVSGVTESGVSKRAVIVLQLSVSGAVTGATLIAKEGGPVGAGPDTWAAIAGGGHASAMNNSGTVVFSGTTTGGAEGVYASGVGFIAARGGPTPTPGIAWGALAGAPVDINNNGLVAMRGLVGNSDGLYTESAADAGEIADEADRTFGNGPLTRISGQLSNDLDVDMFRVRITDPAAFSATTVPDPGTGFTGAAWDTVLTLIASPEEGTLGRVQCDNVSSSVLQSMLTDPLAIAGREYYICISSPKARPNARIWHYATNTFPTWDIWAADPDGLAVAGGMLYFPDPSAGAIRRATISGSVLSDLGAPAVAGHVAVDSAGGKVYWIDRGVGADPEKIRRSNLDGSDIQDLVTASSFNTLAAYYGSGLAIDTVNAKLYWSRSILGEINRCNLDGSGAERVIRDYPPTEAAFPAVDPTGTFAPGALAVDGPGGKVYWINSFLDRIERANLNGTGRTTLAVGAGAADLRIDTAGGHLYWTATGAGKIQRSNLDGTGLTDLLTTPAPVALSLDVAGGFMYWTNTVDRAVRRASLAGAGAADVLAIGSDVGVKRADGAGDGFVFSVWDRVATAAAGPLPYQIRLTGATFRHEGAMLVKGAQKVAAVGDVLPGTAPYPITTVGTDSAAIRISDRGDVLWSGHFQQPTPFNNYLFDALFWNGERLLTSMQIPPSPTTGLQKVVDIARGPYSLDMSRNGQHAVVAVNMQDPPYNFTTQRDNALVLQFTLPPQCVGDFNGSGTVTVQDIFDFLGAYFSSSPTADINGSGAVTVQDIFDFLAAYFAGCP